MKLCFIFICVSIGLIQASNSYAQNAVLNLNVKNQTVENVLKQIESQSEFTFFYNTKQIDVNRKVSIAVSKKDIFVVLNEMFQGTNVAYSVLDKSIILTDKQNTKQVGEYQSVKQDGGKTISGQIKDRQGEPLIGVNVVIKGTTNGIATDVDGKYTIKVTNKDVLVFSYMGYLSKEVLVGTNTTFDLVMEEDNVILGDVVVTALGLKREAKALTYNVQEIKAGELTTVKDANFINSLAGKVAGVQINSSASGIGGSSRVVMRGTKSLFGENNALYVIDGVPIISTKNEQPESFYESPDGGDSDPISFLNTDDVESISVLTGAAAAALYGSQGANGVILITTKRGEAGKLKMSYSNSTQFMSPFVMPEFQNTYGTKDNAFNSWGAKLEAPSCYDPKDFFQTGYTEMNSLSASVGSERNQTFVSLAAMQARGILPNNDLNRLNMNIRNSTDLIKNKLSLDLAMSYARQKDLNMMTQGQFHNPLLPLYLFPRGDDFNKYKVYERYNAERNFKTQFWPYGNQGLGMQNPYWITNRERFQNKTDRYSITGSLKYNVLDWLNVAGRVRMDNTENTFTRKISASSDLMFASENGYYQNRKLSDKQIYADILANIDKRFNNNISLTSTIGASIMDMKNEVAGLEGFLSQAPNFFSFSNIDMADAQTKPIQSGFQDQTQALFATLQVGYNSLVYLDLTARNEWASQLAFTKGGTSFFYPSVGLSGVLSDIFEMPRDIISFMKLRTSYSEVGNAPQRYITRNSYGITNGVLDLTAFYPADGLKPERTKAFEIGTNIHFLKNQFNLDVTYYNSNTYNQLFKVKAGSSAVGISHAFLNAGKVNNWGFEVALGYKNSFGSIGWNSNLTYTLNRNKIKELVPEGTIDPTTGKPMSQNSLNVCENGSYRMQLNEGASMGEIYVSTLRKDNNGYVHVDGESGAVTADPQNWVRAGNVNPKYNLGWNNTISFKGIDLSFLIDARIGGVGVSATQALMDRYGTSASSAKARDEGGVLINDGRLNPENYYAVIGGGTTGILSEYVYSSTNVRLREASLGYTFPAKLFNGNIDQLSISLIARNLLMIYNKAPYDPETTASTGTYYQGFDYFMQPSLKSLGFSVKVQF
ncbi:MAG: SusC/RagA family TonB-linked outer membrane protein [Prevotella sp.]|nr:SusC/RagA family TonB-linked outer membrane protein [Prevotella sp.]